MQNLKIKIASEAQREVCIQREYQGWSAGLSRKSFDRRRADLKGESPGYWSKGKRRWVLVPEEDPETLDILSSCATHRRPCLIKVPSQPLQRSVIYGIAHVLTPEEHRRKGYAALLMTLLHQELNPNGTIPMPFRRNDNIIHPPPIVDISDDEEAEEVTEDREYGRDAAASHLYSIIGDYYEPYGWRITGVDSTIWKVGKNQTVKTEKSPDSTSKPKLEVKEISEKELVYFSDLDEQLLISELQSAPFPEDEEGNPLAKSRIAIVDPEAEAWKCLVYKAKAFASEVVGRRENEIPAVFGAAIFTHDSENSHQEGEKEEKEEEEASSARESNGGKFSQVPRSWCIWTIDYQNNQLLFLRHRISKDDPEDLSLILDRAKEVAREQNLERIAAWNVDQAILKRSGKARDEAKTQKRTDNLASICTYGNWAREIEWWNNEYGCYC